MKVVRRCSLAVTLLAAAILLGLAGRRDVSGSVPAADATAQRAAAQQFYARALGNWVGTTVSQVNEDAPVTGYFHLIVARVDENTYREQYLVYRVLPTTGALERSGTQTYLSTIASSGTIQRTCRGNGTILIDYKPKKQSFEASGSARFAGPDQLDSQVQGKIAVEGMPLGSGKNGKLRKATATFALAEDRLTGQMRFEASFGVLFFSKRFRIASQLQAWRGTDVRTVANRIPPSPS